MCAMSSFIHDLCYINFVVCSMEKTSPQCTKLEKGSALSVTSLFSVHNTLHTNHRLLFYRQGTFEFLTAPLWKTVSKSWLPWRQNK